MGERAEREREKTDFTHCRRKHTHTHTHMIRKWKMRSRISRSKAAVLAHRLEKKKKGEERSSYNRGETEKLRRVFLKHELS